MLQLLLLHNLHLLFETHNNQLETWNFLEARTEQCVFL